MAELVKLRAFFHKHDAQMAQGLLQDGGVDSMLLSDDCGGYRPHLTLGMNNVILMVRQEDFKQAQEILQVLDEPIDGEQRGEDTCQNM